jgi:hypothetical protein
MVDLTPFRPGLSPVQGKAVVARFDGGRLSSEGGLLALREIERRLGSRLAIGCLVMRYISEHAARRPGPDLPGLLWEFDHEIGRAAYRWLGLPDPDAPQRYPRRRRELFRRDIDLEEICAAIPNNCCSWEEWNKIGLAIYAASGGSEEGRIAFDDFSFRCSAKYDPHAVEERWANYGRSPPSRIGLGTLVHLAQQAGWRPNRGAVS